MEKKNVVNLTFASSLTNLCELNSSFDTGVLRIAYAGKNRNMTSIDKKTFERCIKTMYNCPIVCNYDRETGTLGGHDMEVVTDSDGSVRIINATTPVGVIPESARYWWTPVQEEDGSVHEYLHAEALIWKRQEAYKKIKEDGVVAHSMEIGVNDADVAPDGYIKINDFEFNAFCLIGVEPCFESSSLVFSGQGFKEQFSMMMQEVKDTLTKVDTSEDVEDIHPQKYSMEGGDKVLDEKMKLVAEYGIDLESLDFSIEDFTEEELKEKFEAMTASNTEPASEPTSDSNDDSAADETFALTGQIVDEVLRQLDAEKFETAWGEEPRYWYIDCDFEQSQVYAYDLADWLVYGFAYAKDGDAITIDFDSKKRKKFEIVDFEEGEQESPIASVFAHAEKAIKDNAEWEAKYNEASEAITSMEEELTDLKQFKADTEAAEAAAKREAVFELFKDLEGIEAFESLRENCSDMSEETLRKECFAIRGEYGVKAKFSAEPQKAPKLKVESTEPVEDEPYGGIVEEYSRAK